MYVLRKKITSVIVIIVNSGRAYCESASVGSFLPTHTEEAVMSSGLRGRTSLVRYHSDFNLMTQSEDSIRVPVISKDSSDHLTPGGS